MRKRRSNKKNSFDLEMTSLLDILVIIVFFLVISYSASTVEIDIQNNIDVPLSQSTDSPTDLISIKVDRNNIIWFDQKKVKNDYDADEGHIISLYNTLAKKRASLNMISKGAGIKNSDDVINLIIDKNVKYEMIKKIMNTTYKLGITQFKFIVLGKE